MKTTTFDIVSAPRVATSLQGGAAPADLRLGVHGSSSTGVLGFAPGAEVREQWTGTKTQGLVRPIDDTYPGTPAWSPPPG